MAKIVARIDTKAIEIALGNYPKQAFSAVKKAMVVEGKKFTGQLVKKRLSGRPGLIRRSGQLARSFDSIVLGKELNTLRLVVFTTAPYARIHEYGGKVTPTNKQFLAIPLSAVKTKAGVARAKPMDFVGQSFFLKSSAGNLLLVKKDKGKLTPLFVLKKQVKIPPRLKLRVTWKAYLPKIVKAINDALKSAARNFAKGK